MSARDWLLVASGALGALFVVSLFNLFVSVRASRKLLRDRE